MRTHPLRIRARKIGTMKEEAVERAGNQEKGRIKNQDL
jgi:hypothetical protein